MNIYEDMIDKINTYGWGRTRLISANGSVCILGAKALAMGIDLQHASVAQEDTVYQNDEHVQKIALVIAEQYPEWVSEFQETFDDAIDLCYSFNDHNGRTKEEIIAILEKAAASA